MHRHVWEVLGEIALVPGVGVTILENIVNPPFRYDCLASVTPAFRDQKSKPQEVARSSTEPARAARRAEPIDGDVTTMTSSHRLPQKLAHEIRITLTARALDDPAHQI